MSAIFQRLVLLTIALLLVGGSPAQAQAQENGTFPALNTLVVKELPGEAIALWPYLRVLAGGKHNALSPQQAAEKLLLGQGVTVRHFDDDLGRHEASTWSMFQLASDLGTTTQVVLSTRQTTVEEVELFESISDGKQTTWVPRLGRHQLAKRPFERDRNASFDLVLQPGEKRRFLIRSRTAAPAKFMWQLWALKPYEASTKIEHFAVSLAYAFPIALLFMVYLLRKTQGTRGDHLFAGVVIIDLLASSWLIGLAPEVLPRVSEWTFRYTGQMAYSLLAFFICWHQRRFLELDQHLFRLSTLLRLFGWFVVLATAVLALVDIKLAAAATLPLTFISTVICTSVALYAYKQKIAFAGTYALALAVYLCSALAYVAYYLGLVPMVWFGILAFWQTAGVCIIMSWAVAKSVLSKDQRLTQALLASDQQRRQNQTLALERDRLFAAANHDLRQPLQAVALNLELLRQQKLSPEQHQITSRMRLALASMSNMLASFLDLRRANQTGGEKHLQAVALTPIFEMLGLEYRELARAKGLSFKIVQTRAVVMADRVLLERVIRNLLSNALRYTDSGRVLLGARRRGARWAICTVDSGRGLAKENLDRILTPINEQGSSVKPLDMPGRIFESDSYGLGLYIVRTICERINGQLRIRSKLGKGSSFEIELDAASLSPSSLSAIRLDSASFESPEPSSDSSIQAQLAGRHFIVVDDDNALLESLKAVLEMRGAAVSAFATADAFQRFMHLMPATAQTYDAIICDFDLGDRRSGLEHLIDLPPRFSNATRVLISGQMRHEIETRARRYNIKCFSKPLPLEKFIALLAELDSKA